MEKRIGKVVDVEIERYGGGHNIAGILYFEVLGETGFPFKFQLQLHLFYISSLAPVCPDDEIIVPDHAWSSRTKADNIVGTDLCLDNTKLIVIDPHLNDSLNI